MRSSRRREASPLPGENSVNAQILRRLIALNARLVKGEIEFFGKSILPLLLDARAEASSALLSHAKMIEGGGYALRSQQLATVLREIDATLQKVAGQASGELAAQLSKVGAQYADDTLSAMMKSIPGLKTEIFSPVNAEEIENIAARRAGKFEEWISKTWPNGSVKAIGDELAKSVALGEDIEEASRRLVGKFGTSIEHARVVSRSAIHANALDVRMQFLEENEDVFDGMLYVATLDDRTCPICGPYDGEEFPIRPGSGESAGPEIPQHPRCRCTYTPVVSSWEDIGLDPKYLPPGTRASMNGEVPDTLTYTDWLAAQESAEGESWMLDYLSARDYIRWQEGHRDEIVFASQVSRWQIQSDRAALAAHEKKWRRS